MKEYNDEALSTKVDEFTEFNDVLREYRWLEIRPYVQGRTVLDVGCGNTYMIEQMDAIQGFEIWGIDPDPLAVMGARDAVPGGEFQIASLEEFGGLPYGAPLFDAIICSHVIEHSEDPHKFLKGARRNIQDRGILIVSCPNALSLHKRVSEIAGLSVPYELSVTDHMQNHAHVFDRLKLEAFVRGAGFEIIASKGIMLKPFPNVGMTELMSRRLADAFYEVGKDPALIDYCSSIMIVAVPR